jgi:hypothetical protein
MTYCRSTHPAFRLRRNVSTHLRPSLSIKAHWAVLQYLSQAIPLRKTIFDDFLPQLLTPNDNVTTNNNTATITNGEKRKLLTKAPGTLLKIWSPARINYNIDNDLTNHDTELIVFLTRLARLASE